MPVEVEKERRRYAFVTSGVQGLGRAIVKHLAQQHWVETVQVFWSPASAKRICIFVSSHSMLQHGVKLPSFATCIWPDALSHLA